MAQVGLARVTSGNQVSPADPHQLPRRCLRGVRRSSSSSVLAGRFWRTCLVAVSKMHLPQYNSILRRLSLAITPPSKKSLNIREKRVSTRCRRGRPPCFPTCGPLPRPSRREPVNTCAPLPRGFLLSPKLAWLLARQAGWRSWGTNPRRSCAHGKHPKTNAS